MAMGLEPAAPDIPWPRPTLKFGVNGIEVREGSVPASNVNRQSLQRWGLATVRERGFRRYQVREAFCGLLGFLLRWPPGTHQVRPRRLLVETADRNELDRTGWERCDGCPLAFSPDSRLIVTGMSGACEVWRPRRSENRQLFSMPITWTRKFFFYGWQTVCHRQLRSR
jgi:hypothetical protein